MSSDAVFGKGVPIDAAARLDVMRLEMEELERCREGVDDGEGVERCRDPVEGEEVGEGIETAGREYGAGDVEVEAAGVGSIIASESIDMVVFGVLGTGISSSSSGGAPCSVTTPFSAPAPAAFAFASSSSAFCFRCSSSTMLNRIASSTIISSNSCPTPSPIEDKNVAISSFRRLAALLDSLVLRPDPASSEFAFAAAFESITAAIREANPGGREPDAMVGFEPSPGRGELIPTVISRSPTCRKTIRRFARRATVARIVSSLTCQSGCT